MGMQFQEIQQSLYNLVRRVVYLLNSGLIEYKWLEKLGKCGLGRQKPTKATTTKRFSHQKDKRRWIKFS